MENKDIQEVDLGDIFLKIKDFFKSLIVTFFKFLLYIKKNILKIAIFFITGIVLGYYLDNSKKTYIHEIIVTPNVKSVDYFNNRIDLLNSLLKEKDTNILYKKGFRDIDEISKVFILPIVDVFKVVEGGKEKNSNFELIKLMAEDGDLNKIMVGDEISKNYPLHKVFFKTGKKINEIQLRKAFMNFLNDDIYYQEVLNQEIENIKRKIIENDSIINQINVILNTFKTSSQSSKSSSLVYFNENTQLNDIIYSKDKFINENNYLKLKLIDHDKIIKDVSCTFNMIDHKGLNGKMLLLLPFVFVFLYLLVIGFYKSYKKYTN